MRLIALSTCVVTLLSAIRMDAVGQTERTAPVAVTADYRTDARPGQDTSTSIVLRATADLKRLDVTIAAGSGLEIRSGSLRATFESLKRDETREIPVTVRLIAPAAGYIRVTLDSETQSGQKMGGNISVSIGPREQPAPVKDIEPDANVSELTFLNSGGGAAAVRFGNKRTVVVTVGNRVGKTRAEVKEVNAERLVLEEVVVDANGRPKRTQIILKKGETGGTRYELQPDAPPPARQPAGQPGDPNTPR